MMPPENGKKNTEQMISLKEQQNLISEKKKINIEPYEQIKELESKYAEIKSDLQQSISIIREEIHKLKEESSGLKTTYVEEIYNGIDIWTADMSNFEGNVRELSSTLSSFMRNKEKVRSDCKTTDNYISYIINMLEVVKMHLYELIPILKERTLYADDVKRKINKLLNLEL